MCSIKGSGSAEAKSVTGTVVSRNDADLILFNGKILTVDKNFSQAEAVAVKTGRVLAVGKKEEAFRFAGPHTERIDLKGLTVIPGIIDSHYHLEKRGLMLLPGFPW